MEPAEKIEAIRERQNVRIKRRKEKRPYGSPGEILRVYEQVTKDCEYLLKTVDRLQAQIDRVRHPTGADQ